MAKRARRKRKHVSSKPESPELDRGEIGRGAVSWLVAERVRLVTGLAVVAISLFFFAHDRPHGYRVATTSAAPMISFGLAGPGNLEPPIAFGREPDLFIWPDTHGWHFGFEVFVPSNGARTYNHDFVLALPFGARVEGSTCDAAIQTGTETVGPNSDPGPKFAIIVMHPRFPCKQATKSCLGPPQSDREILCGSWPDDNNERLNAGTYRKKLDWITPGTNDDVFAGHFGPALGLYPLENLSLDIGGSGRTKVSIETGGRGSILSTGATLRAKDLVGDVPIEVTISDEQWRYIVQTLQSLLLLAAGILLPTLLPDRRRS